MRQFPVKLLPFNKWGIFFFNCLYTVPSYLVGQDGKLGHRSALRREEVNLNSVSCMAHHPQLLLLCFILLFSFFYSSVIRKQIYIGILMVVQ